MKLVKVTAGKAELSIRLSFLETKSVRCPDELYADKSASVCIESMRCSVVGQSVERSDAYQVGSQLVDCFRAGLQTAYCGPQTLCLCTFKSISSVGGTVFSCRKMHRVTMIIRTTVVQTLQHLNHRSRPPFLRGCFMDKRRVGRFDNTVIGVVSMWAVAFRFPEVYWWFFSLFSSFVIVVYWTVTSAYSGWGIVLFGCIPFFKIC